jgi:hypothetical protein
MCGGGKGQFILMQFHLKMHDVSMYENCNDLVPKQEWLVATHNQLVT